MIFVNVRRKFFFPNFPQFLTVFLKEKLGPSGVCERGTQTLHTTRAEVNDLSISDNFRQFLTVFSKDTPVPGAFRGLRTQNLPTTRAEVDDFER